MPEVHEFSAIAGLDIFDQIGGTELSSGDTFTMPFSTVCIDVTDDDPVLSGGSAGLSLDDSLQTAEISSGESTLIASIYAARSFTVVDQSGNDYVMIEIETVGSSSDRFYTFYGVAPPPESELNVTYVEEGNQFNLDNITGGLKWLPESDGSFTIEAEDMRLQDYTAELSNNASNGQVIRLTKDEGEASLVFGGTTGTYDLSLRYIDEDDGQGTIEILINGEIFQTVDLNQDDDGNGFQDSTVSTFTINDLVLERGDEITLRGARDGNEFARIDALSFHPHRDPIAQDDAFSMGESGTTTQDILDNDTDPNGDPLVIIDVDGNPVNVPFSVTSDGGREANIFVGASGALNFAADTAGNFEDLAANETDVISLSYTVSDGTGLTDTATVTVTVNGENDDPVAMDDGFTMTEEGIYADNLLANDTDVDASDLVQITSANGNTIDPSLGGAALFNIFSADGRQAEIIVSENFGLNVAINPGQAFQNLAVGETDTVTFSYDITDNNGGSDTADVTVTITGENDGPDAVDDDFSVDEGNVLNSSLLGNDTDVDTSDTLTILSAAGHVVDPTSGMTTFEITSAGGRTGNMLVAASGALDMAFDQDGAFDDLGAGETDTVSFTYTITDGNGETDTATATITIDGQNDAPTANDDAFSVDEGVLLDGSLLANDTDSDASDTLRILSADGNVINPAIGISIFEVTSDGGRTGNMVVAASGTLDVAFDQDGAFDDLGAGETDTVSFSYTISDGNGATDTATATITIDGQNDAPTANDDAFSVDEGVLLDGSLLANDTDSDASDTLRILSADGNVINPAIGISIFEVTSDGGRTGNMVVAASGTLDVAFDQNGAFDDLNQGETDTVTFAYTITDGNGETDTATATIIVDGENDAPTANDDTFSVNEGVLLDGSLLANDTDSDASDTLRILSADGNVINPAIGISIFEVTSDGGRTGNMVVAASGTLDVAFDQDGAFDDLGAGETDTVSFTYTITDGNGATDTATATITVDGQNDAPTANDDAFSVDEGVVLGDSLLANDTDADTADILSILEAGGNVINPITGITIFEVTSTDGRTGNMFVAASGALDMAFDQNGAFEDLAEGETDTISFTYTITDGNGETDTATATITVDGENDGPTANDDTFQVAEGVLLGQSLLANDTEIDAPDTLTIISAAGNVIDPEEGIAIFEVTSADGRSGNMFVASSGVLDMAFDQDGEFDDLATSETDTVSFSYTISDGNGGTDTATATITVVGDGPATVTTGFEAASPNTSDLVSLELTTESTTDDGLVDGDIEINFVSLPETSVIAAQIIVFDDSDVFGTIVDTIEFDVPGAVDDPVNPDLVVNGSIATADFEISGLASDLGDANRAALVVQFDDNNDGIVDLPLFVEVDIFGSG